MSSPQGRLPLHLCYRFSEPGSYVVRLRSYDPWTSQGRKIVAESEWTPLEVKPFSAEQRNAWVSDKVAHQPDDAGLIVGDYLPSLLARPDQQVFVAVLRCLHHPNRLVQDYALSSLDYFSDDAIKREIPQVIAKEGPTEPLAYYLSWRRQLFQPIGKQLVDSIIPYLESNSAGTAGAAVHALLFMMPPSYQWDGQPAVPDAMVKAVWAAAPHIRKFKEREALWPLVLFMGQLKTQRAREFLWQMADVPSVREQALICLCYPRNVADLPKLGKLLVASTGSLAYGLRNAYSEAAIPYLLEGTKNGRSRTVVESSVRELVRSASLEGWQLCKDALENNRPYKWAVVNVLRSESPGLRHASDADLLELVHRKLASFASGH